MRRATDNIVALGVGVLLMGLVAARTFGRFHGGNSPLARDAMAKTTRDV